MDDEVAVRVGHGRADGEEELQPPLHREALLVAVLHEREALDVLHDEVGQPVLRLAAVEDLGDVRVVERGENLPLVAEAAEDVLKKGVEYLTALLYKALDTTRGRHDPGGLYPGPR